MKWVHTGNIQTIKTVYQKKQNRNMPLMSKEIVIKSPPRMKSPGSDVFTGEFYYLKNN